MKLSWFKNILGQSGEKIADRLFKDTGFSEEREWRLFIPLDEDDLRGFGCEYRVRNGIIVPYKDIPFETGSIREVVLGPKNLNSEQDVERFLESKDVWGVAVRRSKIPYC